MLSLLRDPQLIMYTVVGAILLVAAFGIYNIISTIVLREDARHRDPEVDGLHASATCGASSCRGR